MTSYEQQMLQGLQKIFNLLNNTFVPFVQSFNDFVFVVHNFLLEYSLVFKFFGFTILLILTLKWLSRW